MKYPYLLFDADNTLFDFDAAEKNAHRQVCGKHRLAFTEEGYALYRRCNAQLWQDFDRGLCSKEFLLTERFRRYLSLTGGMGDPEAMTRAHLRGRGGAEALVDRMPESPAAACRGGTPQALTQQYQSAVRDGGHQALIEMMKAIRHKQGVAEAKNRRLGMIDERYMKQAERMLYGELATALEIGYDDVEDYIAARLEGAAEFAG